MVIFHSYVSLPEGRCDNSFRGLISPHVGGMTDHSFFPRGVHHWVQKGAGCEAWTAWKWGIQFLL